eukprot:gb/GEZN01007246.1/.p1 GENE.gb/GEZN01007246.1/~~gb/GEZN01007246.1/.p1  ORF type:complete len:299 (-),score=53.69 gb/GEZN01007246.1/:353-1249(-)
MPALTLTNDLISTEKLENSIFAGFLLGFFFFLLSALFGEKAKTWGPRTAKVWVELQRKSFHMIGGCLICTLYHWGIKNHYLTSAYLADAQDFSDPNRPMDGASAFIAVSFVCWMIEASRLLFESIEKMYEEAFKGLLREKEFKKAAGIAYFLPGCLAAMMAGPSNIALMGVLFLSVGDAAASIGTAGGSFPVGKSARKWEGSIGCFTICLLIGLYLGLETKMALVTAALVSVGELLAEVIGLDDNLVIPMLGVLGVRIALAPQVLGMVVIMGGGVGVGCVLGMAVASTSRGGDKSKAK